MSNNTENTQTSKISIPAFFRTDLFVMLCLYAGTLLIHILISLCVTIFNLTPDEYSVTAIAAYLNGYDWSSTVSTGGYYGYFQGLFYTPVFLLTDDPYLQYDLMIGINSVLMSFAPVISYYLSRKVFDVNKAASVLFSVIAGIYPCYVLLTKYTWNETLCNIIPWVFLLIMFKSLECKSPVKKQVLSVLGGLILVAGYATHGRMLALMAGGIVLVLTAFFVMKKRIFGFIGFFSSIVVGFACDMLLKDHFQNALWLVDQLDKTPTNTIEKMLSRILGMDTEAVGYFFKTLIGHFFYFISSTWGFGAICMTLIIGVMFMYFRSKAQISKAIKTGAEKIPTALLSDNDALLTIFAFLVMGAVFVVSVAFKCTSTVLEARADTLIYGRYTEVFYPLAIFATLILVYRGKLSLWHTFAALCSGAVINLLTNIFVVPVVTAGDRMVSAMIMGLAPMRYGEKMKDLPTEETFLKIFITVLSILFVILIIQLVLKQKRNMYKYFSFPMAALMMYTNIFCYMNYIEPQSRNAAVGARYMSEAIDMIADSKFNSVCCYSLAKERYVKAQFLYPDMEFVIASSASALSKLEKRPDFIVSDREDALQMCAEDVYLVGDINHNVNLFACTAEAYNWAKEQGLAVSGNGYVCYSGADIPATSTVQKTDTTAICPKVSAVYTNYTTLYKPGTYYFTATGEGVDLPKTTITFTSDKGENEVDYTVIQQGDGVLKLQVTIDEKLENVRLKLSNNNEAEILLESITIEMSEDISKYVVAKNVDYVSPAA